MANTNMRQFKWWAIECIASFIVTCSYYDQLTSAKDKLDSEDRWILYTGIASVAISILGILACIIQRERSVCGVDSMLVWLVAILWTIASIVAIIGPPRDNDQTTLLLGSRLLSFKPNVYFFSLWSLTVSMIMVASWVEEFVTAGGTEWSASTRWIVLAAMSLFTMLSALHFRDQNNFLRVADTRDFNITKNDIITSIEDLSKDNASGVGSTRYSNLTVGNLVIANLSLGDESDPYIPFFQALLDDGIIDRQTPCETSLFSCVRINYAIGLSAATAVVSCLMTPWKGSSPKCQTDISMVLFVLWLPGLVTLTSEPGPATRAGNLYFGIFICYFLVLSIMLSSATCRINTKKRKDDRTFDIERSESSPELITRGDVWQAAYGKLEKNTRKERDRSDSYESLFETADEWDTLREDQECTSMNREESGPGSFIPRQKLGRRSFDNNSMMYLFQQHQAEEDTIVESTLDPEDWKRRVDCLGLWCVLLTMGIVLTYTCTKYDEVETTPYIIFSISILMSCIGIITCLRTSMIPNIFQLASILIEFVNWSSAITLFLRESNPLVFGYTSPQEEAQILLGERSGRFIDDPNIFFGIWISVIAAILLITNRCQASLTTTDWLLFATASVALLTSSMESNSDGDDFDANYNETCITEQSLTCRQQKFAMYLAVASIAASVPMILLSRCIGPKWHVAVSIPLVITWGFGVAYVTFSNAGETPAATYFAFWGAIPLTLDIATINSISLYRIREKMREERNESEGDGIIAVGADINANRGSIRPDLCSKEESKLSKDTSISCIFDESQPTERCGTEFSPSDVARENDDILRHNHNITDPNSEKHLNHCISPSDFDGDYYPEHVHSELDGNHHYDPLEKTAKEISQSMIEPSSDGNGIYITRKSYHIEAIDAESDLNSDSKRHEDAKSIDTNDFVDCNEDEGHLFMDDSLKETTVGATLPFIDSEMYQDGSSIETNEFRDCYENELSSH